MRDIIYTMSQKGLGITSVVDADGRLAGIITDGDLRRRMEVTPDIVGRTAPACMTRIAGHLRADGSRPRRCR